MIYIQRKDNENGQLETVDEFESRNEAKKMLTEYRMSDPLARFYMSMRACKDWRDK